MICIIIYIFIKSYILVNLWYKNLKLDLTYSPKWYLIFVIPEVVGIDHVHYQNTQLFSTGLVLWILWKWKLRRLKVERKMSFSHSPHNMPRFLVRLLSPQISSPSRIGLEKIFWCSLLSQFHLHVSLKQFVRFSYCTNRPDIIFQVSAPDLKHLLIASLHF